MAVEIAEISLDAFMDEGVLKEVPILKTVLAARKTWTAIHDQLFLRKVAGFIRASPRFTQTERESFAREYLDDPTKAKKLGDAIVLILDKLDDLDKPEMIAKIFAALVRGKIEKETFRRLAAAIDIGFIADLRALARPFETRLASSYLPSLLRTDLVVIAEREDKDAYVRGSYRIDFQLAELGRVFQGCMEEPV